MYIFYKSKFMRTLNFEKEKKIRTKLRTMSDMLNITERVSTPAILKILTTKHQNRAWFSLILYCMQSSLFSLFYCHTLI